MLRLYYSVAILFMSGSLFAESFPLLEDIPQSYWTPTQEDLKDADAYLIKHLIRFDENRIHYYLLARIQSPLGRDAVRVSFDKDLLASVDGRVIQRSGKQTTFDSQDSLINVLVGSFQNETVEQSYAFPPGVSDDCIVEIRFSIKAEKGLPKDHFFLVIPVQADYFTLEKVITYPQSLNRFSNEQFATEFLNIVTRFRWSPYPDENNFKQVVRNNTFELTYTNVPARPSVPYSLDRHSTQQAWVTVSRTMPYQGMSVNHFWDKVAKNLISLTYYPYSNGFGEYGSWIRELKASLKGTPEQALYQINDAIRARITAIHMMTPEQMGNITTEKLMDINWWDVEAIFNLFKQGYASRHSLAQFAIRVCRDLGLRVHVMFPPADPSSPFDPVDCDALMLDYDSPIIGFQAGEHQWITIAPAHPEYANGEIPLEFQDLPLLAVDPDFKSSKFVKLPRNNWQKNQELTSYSISFRPDGMVNASVKTKLKGLFEVPLRVKLKSLSEMSRELWLESHILNNLDDYKVFEKRIEHLDDPKAELETHYKLGTQLTNDQGRIRLEPFPGSTPFLSISGNWQNQRTSDIYTYFDGASFAISKINMPRGWKCLPVEGWQRENEVGSVSWKVELEKDHVKVSRKVILKKGKLPANKDQEFKAFLGWVIQAHRQQLAFVAGEDV